MPDYSVGFPSAAVEKRFQKELSSLDKGALLRVKEAMDSLACDPRPRGKKIKTLRPPLQISFCVAQYRIRVGDYRVFYDVDDKAGKVVLLAIRRRSEKTYRR